MTEINERIAEINILISDMENEKRELIISKILSFKSENVWYEEKVESHPRGKCERKVSYLDGKLVGRVYWKQYFKDEDTVKYIAVERTNIVRVEGDWTQSIWDYEKFDSDEYNESVKDLPMFDE